MLKYTFFFIIIFIVGDNMNPRIPNIEMDNLNTIVTNKNEIINFIRTENNKNEIEQYIKHKMNVIEKHPNAKVQDVIDIIEECNKRINHLKGLDKLPEVVENTKKETNNLNNIEVIYTPYYINDKNKEGFRHDTTYIKIKDEIYEVRNVDRILSFLGNKDILKNLSEFEIIKFIKEYSGLIKTNNLDRINGKITTEEIEEEIKQESDSKIREALNSHKNDVIKEREKLEEYIGKNNPSATVKYGVNSNEERIYTVGEELIKFVGSNREMQILSELDIETMNREFENKQGYDNNIDNSNRFKTINDFSDEIIENEIDTIVEKMYNEEELTNEEIEMLRLFLELYIDNPEQVSYIYTQEVNKWFENNYGRQNDLPTVELQELYEKIRVYRLNKTKNLDNRAFITTFAILETSLVMGLIYMLMRLFN